MARLEHGHSLDRYVLGKVLGKGIIAFRSNSARSIAGKMCSRAIIGLDQT